MANLVHHFLEKSSDRFPDKSAVVHGKECQTYLSVERAANRIAYCLMDFGLRKGERVGILQRNSMSYIISYYGALKAGGVVVPLNTALSANDIFIMLNDSSPTFLLFEKHFLPMVEELFIRGVPFLRCLAITDADSEEFTFSKAFVTHYSRIFSEYPDQRPNLEIASHDVASIVYTSGSTGKPKGVTLTHRNIASNTASIISYLELTQKDRIMVVLPFYYVYGKSLLNTHFAVSGTVIIENRFAFPNLVLNAMVAEKATGFSGVPSTYAILLNRSAIKKTELPSLRYFTQAGGHMAHKYKELMHRLFPEKQFFVMYGATEASARISYLPPEMLLKKINSIGKPIPGVRMAVFKNNFENAGPYEIGEIVARGANIMLGYWNSPEETEKAVERGWYFTGDLGYSDKEGFFYITGRKKDMIKVGLYKISTTEIEDIILKHPRVFEAAVVGIPDDEFENKIIAFVVFNEGNDLEIGDIIDHCLEYLPKYKIPKRVVIMNSLPKSNIGKILKDNLISYFKTAK